MFNENYEAEEIILSMAYIVREKRRLEEENAELKEQLKWHKDNLNEQYKESQRGVAEIMRALIPREIVK